MNRGELLEIVRNRGNAPDGEVAALDELVRDYPWFHSAHSIILNTLFKSQSLSFESRLKSSALYVTDREVLYHLLNRRNRGSVKSVDPQPVAGKEEEKSVTGHEPVSGRSRSELQEEINQRLAEIEQGRDEEILIIEDEGIETAEHMETPDEGPVPDFDTSLLEMDYQVFNLTDPEGETSSPGRKRSETELVDKFLVANPRITPVREHHEGESENIAEKVPDRSEELISETLARIYVNQKYYTRAIQVYEKLCLKYPEKVVTLQLKLRRLKN
ncbi:MAG: hypothetical protein R2744_01310 [Bacteroidales bacterium]